MLAATRQARLAWLLVAAFLILSSLAAMKTTFLAYHKDTHSFHLNNFLWDDGGMYVSMLHVFQNPHRLESRAVVQRHSRQRIARPLARVGTVGSSRTRILLPHLYDGYFSLFLFLNRFVGDINRAYSLGLLLIPFGLFVKYFILLAFVVRGEAVLPVVLFNLFSDLAHVTAFHGSSYFAMPLFLLGLSAVLFGHNRPSRVAGYGFLVLSCTVSVLPFAPP